MDEPQKIRLNDKNASKVTLVPTNIFFLKILNFTWESWQRYNIAAFWTIVPGPPVSPHFLLYNLNIEVQRPLSLF